MAKSDVESKTYADLNEQFQAIAWITLLSSLAEMLILDRKNPLLKNIHLFSNKKWAMRILKMEYILSAAFPLSVAGVSA